MKNTKKVIKVNLNELKQIEGFPSYYITKEGKVFHVKEINPCDTLYGYNEVALYENNKTSRRKVHRLVAEAFLDNPENFDTIHHKNGNKQDNRVENLEWVENKEHVLMHNGKKDIIDGIEYKSLRKAEKSLGINRARITTAMEKYKTNILNSNMIRR